MACLIRVISFFFAILNATIVIYRFQGFGCGFLKDSENERVKANPNATNSYRMAKILLKLGCGRNFIYLPDNKKDNTYRNCNHETELFLWPFGDKAT